MKKLLAMLLGGAMFATAIAGLAGCNDEPDTPGPGPGPGPGPETPTITRRADTRAADAFEAYDYEGTQVGTYKTIAAAINATIEADLDYFEDEAVEAAANGGYVLKKGGTVKLFQNRKGYASGNSDQFWYYQDGNKLAGFNCWDATNSVSYLRNNKIIAHQTTNMGLTSVQSWNGFALLDEYGQLDTKTADPNSYQLSTAMDAGLMMFPVIKAGAGAGVSGMTYKIDLSEMKITPAYEGVEDPVYAYMGFYIWDPYYVLAVGIACDTTTGQWYEFRGTSRDDSFSDVEYNIGECLFESTWNEEGGYFVPNSGEVTMSIKTQRNLYEEDGYEEEYWTDELVVTPQNGKELKRSIDDEILNNYFSGNSVNASNGYMFIAGLDIKNELGTGAKVSNVDYFNGAKVEDFCVTEAKIYFPTAEEISDVDFGGTIDPNWRGNWYDVLLANDESAEGTYAYTILSNYMCTAYSGRDGADYYNFTFDGDPVGETDFGGQLKEYQDSIDSLAQMTTDNVSEYEELYNEVAKWYGKDEKHTDSTLGQIHLNLLDFAPYLKAVEVYTEALNLSDEAKAVLAALDALSVPTATSYPFEGWSRGEENADKPVAGWFWDEAQEFAKIRTEFNKLPADEQKKVMNLSKAGQDGFAEWAEAYDSVKEYLDNPTYVGKSYTLGDLTMTGNSATYDGAKALERIISIFYRTRTNWFVDHQTNKASEAYVMNSDNTACFQYNFHALFLMKLMEKEEVELPDFVYTMLDLVTNTDRSMGFYDDFNDYLYPVLTLAGQIYQRQQKGEYVWLDQAMADTINAHMIGYEFKENGFAWNLTNNGDLRDGDTNYEYYFGLPNAAKSFKANLDYIFNVVAACDPTAEIAGNMIGFTAPVKPLSEDPTKNGSENAKAVVEKIKALPTFEGYAYKGWTADGGDTAGYLYTELTAFRAVVSAREALETIEKAYVSSQIDLTENATVKANYEAWVSFSAEMKAIEDTDLWTKTFTAFAKASGKDTKAYSGEEAFAELLHVAFKITNDGMTEDAGGDNGTSLGKLDVNNNFNSSARLVFFYDYFMTNGVTLPKFVTEMTDELGVPEYYDNFFYPLSRMVQLAVRINAESITEIEDLTADELAFLNTYWVSTYQMKGILSTHWYANNAYFGWINWKMTEQFTKMLGGTIEGKNLPSDYAEYINNLLITAHYTPNPATHNWGVTATEIFSVTLSENALAALNEFEKIGNLDNYHAKGWKAADGEIAGYLWDEATYYTQTIKPLLDKLTEDEKDDVAMMVGLSNMEDWEDLAKEILALDEATVARTIEAADKDAAGSVSKTYTVGEALGELLTVISRAQNASVKLDFDGGIHQGMSFRAYYFYYTLQDMDVEIPLVIEDRFAAVELDEPARGQFTNDIKYIIAIMKIAKVVTADPSHALTADEVAMINETIVGKDHFEHGGFKWSYVNDGKYGEVVSWHNESKGYKAYFGLPENKAFNEYQKLVIDYLVKNYGATALKYNAGASDPAVPEDNVMGIAENVSVK